MVCRICSSSDVVPLGQFRAYPDYTVALFDCTACGCRFTPRDPDVYERLHRSASSYAFHKALQDKAAALFAARRTAELTATLSRVPKNRFVLSEIAALGAPARLLEVGCSRGYLTACLLSSGHDVLGVDVSRTAIDAARKSFGDHFVLPDDPRIAAGAPYDAIYHVGTIGCVDDPIGLTNQWLSMLRPGGLLVFNAPNRQVCDLLGSKWVFGTVPPDLVTLFTPDFWKTRFADQADAEVSVLQAPAAYAAACHLVPWLMDRQFVGLLSGWRRWVDQPRLKAAAVIGRIGAALGLDRPQPDDFGIHVLLRRKHEPAA